MPFSFKMFNPFQKKKSQPIGMNDIFSYMLASNSLSSSWQKITSQQALMFFNEASPVYTAVKYIVDEVQNIDPLLYNPKKNIFENDSPVLDLLNQPNEDQTREEFIEEIGSILKIATDVYIMAGGNINKPPLRLEVISPVFVKPIQNTKDNYANGYRVQVSQDTYITFKRREENGRFRFIADDFKELWQIRNFNTNLSSLIGSSPLTSIFYDIKQQLQGSKHNLSTLLKGARLSGVLFSENDLPIDKREKIKGQIRENFQGAENAGGIAFFEGGKFDFRAMSESMKDMDFKELKKDVTIAIYNALKIPLALVSPDRMTLSNFEEARLMLYDNAVLPFTKRIYKELSRFLLPRYKIHDEVIFYDISQVPALETRRNQQLKLKKEIGVYTPNELRALTSDDPQPNGDVIYISNNMVPIGTTTIIPQQQKTSKDKFLEIMKKYTNTDGSRKYSDEYIEEIANKNGLV